MWPDGVPMPEGLRFYRRADTGGHPNTLPQWSVPGGLEGVKGWTSYFGTTAKPPVVWSEGDRWRHSFRPGSTFAVMLVNDSGRAFEISQRRREPDRWVEGVIYREWENSPAGYRKLAKDCSECHSQAGVGGLRGDDYTFSFSVTPK